MAKNVAASVKAKKIARLFATYIDGRISYDSFCRYALVINNSLSNFSLEFFDIIKEVKNETA